MKSKAIQEVKSDAVEVASVRFGSHNMKECR